MSRAKRHLVITLASKMAERKATIGQDHRTKGVGHVDLPARAMLTKLRISMTRLAALARKGRQPT